MTVLSRHANGNAIVTLYTCGTREIEYEGALQLEHPLNVDIRVSTSCAFGKKDNGEYGVCDFCHEEAVVNGIDCDYSEVAFLLKDLPSGTEIAIGCNKFTPQLYSFLSTLKDFGHIPNITINQGHLKRDLEWILTAIDARLIYGLGISYRKDFGFNIPQELLSYEHSVVHVIAGIDDVEDVLSLSQIGVKKLLILGEKDFGYNKDRVVEEELYPWKISLPLFPEVFKVVSFDTLALTQLEVRRLFVTQSDYDKFNQGEYSFYIDGANRFISPSSRSSLRIPFDSLTGSFPLQGCYKRFQQTKVLL